MTSQSSTLSPSVFLDMEAPEAPDIQTPRATHGAPSQFSAHTYFPTPNQSLPGPSDGRDSLQFFPPLHNIPAIDQSLTWETEAVPSSASSASPPQYDLPRAIHTPARGLNQLAEQTQKGWNRMYLEINGQKVAIQELTTYLKGSQNSSKQQFKELVDRSSANHQQLCTMITSHKGSEEPGMDNFVKVIKPILEEEVKNSETSLLSEVRFMVEQLQAEIQQELKGFHKNVFPS